MLLNEITSSKIRNIITSSPTPAGDILAIYKDLTEQEAFEARCYFSFNHHATILGHSQKETTAMRELDV